MSNLDVWNHNVPVEKSSYLQDDEITFFNVDEFRHDPEKLNMIDLFCGAGGFSVGCSWAGFQSVFGVDHFEPAVRTWTRNHPHSIACLGDIAKVDTRQVKSLLRRKGITHIHLMTGGVPCQGFSIANRKHNDHDERNYLFLEYMRFVKEFQPDFIILENVSGLRTTAGGKFEHDIKEYMKDLGYETSVQMLNAAEFGVPQVRMRVLFVGVREQSHYPRPFEFPHGTFHRGSFRTVEDALSDLPPLEVNETKTYYESPPQNDYQRLMRGYGPIKEIAIQDVLMNHVAPRHPQSTVDLIRNTKPGQPMYQKFRQRIRLRLDQPSPTQLAGGIRPSFQFGHPTEARGLTTRERARIQSFPDCYQFLGGIVQERVQTGNAVPPLLVYHVAEKIKKELLFEEDQNVQGVV